MSCDHCVHTRREFLTRGLTLAAASGTVPSFLTRAAFALDDPAANEAPRARADERILVVLQLAGGNDGLNTLVPYGDDAYQRARPKLAVQANDVLRISDYVGLHPNLAPLKALYDQGRLAPLQGAGYPNPNRSHFRSMEIWETAADSDRYEHYGWIGRYFDNHCAGQPAPDPTLGLRVGRSMPQSFGNAGSLGVSLQTPEQYRWYPSDRRHAAAQQQAFAALNQPADGAWPPLDFLQRTALNARLSSAVITDLAAKIHDAAPYPNSRLAADLKLVAQLIAGGLGSRVYYVTLGGFDTHANQLNDHPNLMTEMGAAVAAFVADLERQKNLDRVLLLAFSEFGRRVQENYSGGTDHGAAGLMFLAGGAVKPGLAGKHPSLTDLERGDLKFGIDFRSVYATVLKQWLGADPKAVLGREFPLLDLLRA
ncbi:MAG: DUF1501 domain-containing protein [Armatimonadetes bacterium]|nr:DUF1501 domain-containing protein [Armatimonadota bacterium]